jgi:hypothetical protein
MKQTITLIILALVMFSCRKSEEELTKEQKQIHQEQKELLKSNELLEQEGLRFVIKSDITSIEDFEIDLKLYKGSGLARSTTPILTSRDGHMNYSIVSKKLDVNTEYTLTIDYIKVIRNTPYKILIEGFTSMNGSKELLITGKSFAIERVGTSHDIMLIKKGIVKFSISEL